jgi:hypothetical protein
MRRITCRFASVALLSILLGACKFPELPPLEEDARTDATVPDAPTGPAVVSTEQGPHDFGDVVVGELSPILQVIIRDSGGEETGPLSVTLLGTDASEFRIVPTGDSSDCVNARLAGGETCVAQIRFAPTMNTAGSTARLEVSGNPGGTATVQLSGNPVTAADLTSTQASHDFGDIVMGQPSTLLQVVVRNDGEQRSGAISLTLGGANPGDFTIVPTGGSNDCSGAMLALQDTCIAQVRFQPTVAALRTATLDVNASPGGAVTVSLMGDGLSPGNLVVEMPSGGASLDFGMREIATGATSMTQTIRVRNSGGAATGTLDVTLTGGGASSYTIPIENCDGIALGPTVTCDVQVRFNPTVVGTQPATVTIRDTVANTAASVGATGIGSGRVAVTKTGLGTVMSNPTGINCGTGCSSETHSFIQTPISLNSTPDSGYVFTSWSGSCSGSNPSPVCSLTIDQGIENVGALFTQVFVLNTSTTGAGTVTSASPGILCGNANNDCTETYPVGTMVQLNAEPDAGWEVFAWTGTGGASCGLGTHSCTITMSQARNVAVEFRRTYTLNVAVTGSGQGTISGTFTGGSINCTTGSQGTCSSTVFDGTSVTLSQAVGTTGVGSQIVFGGWGTDCNSAGTAMTCTLAINGAKNVSAAFSLQHRLTLSLSGAGMGSVTAMPGTFTCSTGTCTRFYDAGTTLTITATPASGLDGFSSFNGDCSANPCTIANLAAPKSTTASFVRFQCVPSSATCSSGRYTQCDASGNYVSYVIPNGASDGTATTIAMNMYQCPMGCHASQPRCADINASNGLNSALDSAGFGSSGPDLILPQNAGASGNVIIDTSNFDSAAGETTIVDAGGTNIRVPAQVVTQTGAPPVLILKVRTLTIRTGRTVEVRGTRALAVASHFDVYIGGTVDLSGTLPSGPRVVPGASLVSSCSGTYDQNGAGGSGNGTFGAAGTGGNTGGQPFSTFDGIQPLQGGCSNFIDQTFPGGALQISSRTRVAMGSSALIDVSGGGGDAYFIGQYIAFGGASGGSVLLEAPSVELAAGSIIAGRGGSGAAADSGGIGADGNEGPIGGSTGAAPVTCSNCGTSGRGGTETNMPTAATGTGFAIAGGGGAVGRCATRTASGVLVPPSGTMRISYQSPYTLAARSP